jgi:hypothetical protein
MNLLLCLYILKLLVNNTKSCLELASATGCSITSTPDYVITTNTAFSILLFHITTRTMLMIALAIPLVLVIGTIPHQVATVQLTSTQQLALQSLTTTDFTNHQPVTIGAQSFTISYIIRKGQVVAIVPAPTHN